MSSDGSTRTPAENATTNRDPPRITVDAVTVGYDHFHVLSNVSMYADSNELVTLVGPNGAGKSTLLKSIAGTVLPWDGSVWYNGREITNLPTNDRLSDGISFIPQGRSAFQEMTVVENLQMGGYIYDDQKFVNERISKVFDLFPDLEAKADEKAATLSGGQQQMVELGRSLVSDPDVLLVDEPSLGLAPTLVDSMFETLQRLRDEDLCIIMVEQNVRSALNVSDRCYLIASGVIKFAGEPDDLLANDEMRKFYLGQ